MDSVALKLILTPALVGAASVAGRRWGPAISGWLVGLPLTSGPIIFFLALSHDPAFTRSAAVGTLSGTISQALFCLAYGRLAVGSPWPQAVAAGVFAFAGATVVLQHLEVPVALLFLTVVLVVLGVLRLMPGQRATAPVARALPAWDIPARMIVATAYVVGLTALAARLGPHLTGLMAPFPLYGLVLATFAHHLDGGASAINVLRGLLVGLFSCAAFFAIVAMLIARVHVALVFGAAIALALMLQGGSLRLLDRVQQ